MSFKHFWAWMAIVWSGVASAQDDVERCAQLMEQNQPEAALSWCRAAVVSNPSPQNRGRLALALVETGTSEGLSEAEALALEVLREETPDEGALLAYCEVGRRKGSEVFLRTCVERLEKMGLEKVHDAYSLELAQALIVHPGPGRAPESDLREAQVVLTAAVARQPRDPVRNSLLCDVALEQDNHPLLVTCSQTLLEVNPEDPWTHVYVAVREMLGKRFQPARNAANRARELGLEPVYVKKLLDRIEIAELQARARASEATTLSIPVNIKSSDVLFGFGVLLAVALAWLLLVGVLMVMGAVMSKRLEGALERGEEASVDAAYRWVLKAASWSFVLSLPLSALIIVAFGVVTFYYAAITGSLSFMALALVLAIVSAGWFVFRSLRASGGGPDPGMRYVVSRFPQLAEQIKEAAERAQVPPVRTVYLTPDCELELFERGNIVQVLMRKYERSLVLGVGLLASVSARELEALLVEKHALFAPRHGTRVWPVRRSLQRMMRRMEQGGMAVSYNPAWLAFRVFDKAYAVMSRGAARVQLAWADRIAAQHHGAEVFEGALSAEVVAPLRMKARMQAMVEAVRASGEPAPANLYHVEIPEELWDTEALRSACEEAMERREALRGSPRERIAAVEKLELTAVDGVEEDEPAWSLLEQQRESLELEMSEEVVTRVWHTQGIELRPPD